MHHPRNILLVYKKSLRDIYARRQHRQYAARLGEHDWAAINGSHECHARALLGVQAELRRRKLQFHSLYRARHRDFAPYDLIISVGGDGTLIEAARSITTQPLLGVNSDPSRSAGHFCAATLETFAATLDAWCAGRLPLSRLARLQLAVDDEVLPWPVMNDVLVAHRVPAAMSRYTLTVGGTSEAQRGAGLWICTAAGSTGAVASAGGQPLSWRSHRRQYLARELFEGRGAVYKLRRGTVPASERLEVRSLMREGMLYLDGPHLRVPFPHGSRLLLTAAPYPLPLITARA